MIQIIRSCYYKLTMQVIELLVACFKTQLLSQIDTVLFDENP